MTGIDISYAQASWPAGNWEFACVQATHDSHGVDVRAAQHWAEAGAHGVPRRGVYHYANPQASSGHEQARLLASTALGLGFRPGVDFWALDYEEHALGSAAANRAWIADFMATARATLGNARLLYIGWPFYVQTCGSNPDLLAAHPWWLPAYGPNDGTEHALDAGVPAELVVVHQYTSRGGPGGSGLDVNAVRQPAWGALFGAPPVVKPPKPPVPPVQHPTIYMGDVNVHSTLISGIHLDGDGNGEVAVKDVPAEHVIGLVVVGGSDPLTVKRYDKTPTTRVVNGSNPALVVIEGGVPDGTYSLNVSSI